MKALLRAALAYQAVTARRGEAGRLRSHVREDAASRIDWYASARCGRLCVRERAKSTSLAWAALVDDSPSMAVPANDPPLERAYAAAALWCECAAGTDLWCETGCAGRWTVEDALDAALRTLPARCALLCVSDFYGLEDMRSTTLGRAAKTFNCTALVVCDRWGAPYRRLRIRDAESGALRSVSLSRSARERYRHASRERELRVCAFLRESDWRAAVLDRDPARALLQAFGLT